MPTDRPSGGDDCNDRDGAIHPGALEGICGGGVGDGEDEDQEWFVDQNCDGVGGPGWTIETVDSVGNTGWSPSLALDSDGAASVAYFDYGNWNLRYTTNPSGAWVMTTVDSAGNMGWHPSLAVGSVGDVHVAYLDGTNADLRYARSNCP